jgi:hypothetical protein
MSQTRRKAPRPIKKRSPVLLLAILLPAVIVLFVAPGVKTIETQCANCGDVQVDKVLTATFLGPGIGPELGRRTATVRGTASPCATHRPQSERWFRSGGIIALAMWVFDK